MPIPVNFGVNFSLGRIELCEVKQPRGPDALGFRPMTARSCVIRETPFIGSPFIESIPPQVWTALRRNLKAASPFKASASIRYSGYVEPPDTSEDCQPAAYSASIRGAAANLATGEIPWHWLLVRASARAQCTSPAREGRRRVKPRLQPRDKQSRPSGRIRPSRM